MSTPVRSPKAADYHRWYGLARWRRLRDHQLRVEPLCRMCTELGIVTAATVCDHVVNHKGDEAAFWAGPFQSLCQSHHSGDKQSEDKTGARRRKGTGLDGWPLDPQHPVYRGRA